MMRKKGVRQYENSKENNSCPFREGDDSYSSGIGNFESISEEFMCEDVFANHITAKRMNETIEHARRMNYKKLGIAFCHMFSCECRIFIEVLKKYGFACVSVECRPTCLGNGSLQIKDGYTIFYDPIAQAEILNFHGTDFNIVVGLCIGNEFLLAKNAKAFTSVII